MPKKDLALQAISYGNVYVDKTAMVASPQQTLQAFREAEAYDGPSIIIAYSPCIAHASIWKKVWNSKKWQSNQVIGHYIVTTRH